MRYENDNSVLIISPNQKDLDELRIQFKKDDYDKLLYVVQYKGITDTNSYESFVFFEKSGITKLFKEFDNPEHCSYNNHTDESDFKNFINAIKQYEFETDYESVINIFNIEEYKNELDFLLEKNTKKINQKTKI